MNRQKNTPKPQHFPVDALRELLRQQAVDCSTRLSRSVARLTSCDALPCLEYGEEVQLEQALAEQLFYLQHCRNALERCIGAGGAVLRYRWADGRVTQTRFRRVGPSRVKVTGLPESFPAAGVSMAKSA